ncbi:hypothetical protein FN924_11490 [Radiobacillus deserti]|uniref:Uncharacterized protein n=1 Tax=Radiobacillus deserti TaxID=2594883 RepID=A0A516KH96_9BACI|nr:hypothetical protein FN924_11490 [Radiobacillus deserti]
MSRFYRYKLPPWARNCLVVCENVTLPLLIFQAIRTIFFPTTFDVLLCGILLGIYLAFYLKWI